MIVFAVFLVEWLSWDGLVHSTLKDILKYTLLCAGHTHTHWGTKQIMAHSFVVEIEYSHKFPSAIWGGQYGSSTKIGGRSPDKIYSGEQVPGVFASSSSIFCGAYVSDARYKCVSDNFHFWT